MGLTMNEKHAVTRETAKLYQKASKQQKTAILNNFVCITKYHRKYAIRVLSQWGKMYVITNADGTTVKLIVGSKRTRKKRRGVCRYDQAFCDCLKKLWEYFDYMCGKRLSYLIRANIDELVQHEPFGISEHIKAKLLTVSPATIDRKLSAERAKLKHKTRYRGKTSAFLKHKIPIRVSYRFDERRPGFFEFDTVFHDGGNLHGDYCKTLTATDVDLGWTVLTALRNSAHRWVKEAAQELQKTLPYPLKGIDSDNGSEFINTQLYTWCLNQGIIFTRSRSYHKNDNCFVEQKNDYAVRRFVGYYRYDTDEEFDALQNVYAYLNLLINYFYPSQKIISKTRNGAKVTKQYEPCRTPFDRLIDSPFIAQEAKQKAQELRNKLSLIAVKQNLEDALQKLFKIHMSRRKLA